MKCPTGARGVIVTFNAGTSEGAKKGWESRQGGGASARANRASDEAKALHQEHDKLKPELIRSRSEQAVYDVRRGEVRTAYQKAATLHEDAYNALGHRLNRSSGSDKVARPIREAMDYHSQKRAEAQLSMQALGGNSLAQKVLFARDRR